MGKTKHLEVLITRFTSRGKDPLFIEIAQRHLEKEIAAGFDGRNQFTIPADILRLSVPDLYVDEIEEVQLVYKRRSA